MSRDGGTVITILPQGQRGGRPGTRRAAEAAGPIEDAFHDLLHHSGLPIYLLDTVSNRLFINEAFRDIYNQLSPASVKAATDELPVPSALAEAAVGGIYYAIPPQTVVLDQARASQARLDDVIRSTSDWVWESDADGSLTFVSDRITEVFGRLPAPFLGPELPGLWP